MNSIFLFIPSSKYPQIDPYYFYSESQTIRRKGFLTMAINTVSLDLPGRPSNLDAGDEFYRIVVADAQIANP